MQPRPRPAFDEAPLDPRRFRDALGRCPTGVCVVTVAECDGSQCMTVGSFASLSLDPALVMWSVRNQSARARTFVEASSFTVSVLSADQAEISGLYAKRGAKGVHDAHCLDMGDGALLIRDAAAQFVCRKWADYPGGDHTIIIGEVERMAFAPERSPLVFVGGTYATPVTTPTPSQHQKGG